MTHVRQAVLVNPGEPPLSQVGLYGIIVVLEVDQTTVTSREPVPALALQDVRYLIGVDGGGTGTRVRIRDRADGRTIGGGQSGPSGLSQGHAQAWRHVAQAIAGAFAGAGIALPPPQRCALGLALAGAERSSQRVAFIAGNPGYALCLLENDALGALRGAYVGGPGRVVAAGTGSVAAARYADGSTRLIGGWGFPIGDEGSGAWLGMRAVQLAQAAMDGRCAAGALAHTVWALVGSQPSVLLDWCVQAGQAAFASLAPAVFETAAADPRAAALLEEAAGELALLARALEAGADSLPLVVYGSIGERLIDRLPADLRAQCVPPAGDAIDGAFHRLREALAAAPAAAAGRSF